MRLRRLLKALDSLNFKLIRSADVVIWGTSSSELIQETILEVHPNARVTVLDTSGNYNFWALAPAVFSSTFSKRPVFQHYVDNFWKLSRAKLAISFIDNDWRFWWFGARNDITSIVIQNGRRFVFGDVFGESSVANEPGRISHLFCFATPVAGLYEGVCEVENVHAIGSFKNNKAELNSGSEKQGVLWLSSYEPKDNSGVVMQTQNGWISYEAYHAPDILAMKLSARAANDLGIHFRVALRKDADDPAHFDEIGWYKELLSGFDFSLAIRSSWNSTYSEIDRALMVATVDGTAGYESLARGVPTIFLPFRESVLASGASHFGWPEKFGDEGIFWTRKQDYKAVRAKVEEILNLSEVDFLHASASILPSIMAYEPGNSRLKLVLESTLNLGDRRSSV